MIHVRENGERPTQCSFNSERKLTPCWPMEDALELPHGRGVRSRGLILNSMVNTKEHRFSRHMVSIVSGASKAEITFCPFCGVPMSEGAEEAVKHAKEAAA